MLKLTIPEKRARSRRWLRVGIATTSLFASITVAQPNLFTVALDSLFDRSGFYTDQAYAMPNGSSQNEPYQPYAYSASRNPFGSLPRSYQGFYSYQTAPYPSHHQRHPGNSGRDQYIFWSDIPYAPAYNH